MLFFKERILDADELADAFGGKSQFIEVQGTGEQGTFSRRQNRFGIFQTQSGTQRFDPFSPREELPFKRNVNGQRTFKIIT